jgi:hypothetical protein
MMTARSIVAAVPVSKLQMSAIALADAGNAIQTPANKTMHIAARDFSANKLFIGSSLFGSIWSHQIFCERPQIFMKARYMEYITDFQKVK